MSEHYHRHPITLKGITNRNLKNLDVTFYFGELVILTGVSGSGKSSLAFNTVYVEGQRHYLEATSSFLRFRLKDVPKGNVQSIEGLSPTIAVEQKAFRPRPNSTVGTLSGINDLLRNIFASASVPYHPMSGKPIILHNREDLIRKALSFPEGSEIKIYCPYDFSKKETDASCLINEGYVWGRLNGKAVRLSEIQPGMLKLQSRFEVRIDSVIIKPSNRSRIKVAVLQGLKLGRGHILFEYDRKEYFFRSRDLGAEDSYRSLGADDFSFNTLSGRCPKCLGKGIDLYFPEDRIVDPEKSIKEDTCIIAGKYGTVVYGNIYKALAEQYRFNLDTPWKDLSRKVKDVFLYGTGDFPIKVEFLNSNTGYKKTERFYWKGVVNEALNKYETLPRTRRNFEDLLEKAVCSLCNGSRLQSYAAVARFNEKTFPELCELSFADLLSFFKKIDLDNDKNVVVKKIIKHLVKHLELSCRIGLGYLSCSRRADTLSGGEACRISLTSRIHSGATGMTYILDEPSIGLHPQDNQGLIDALKSLRDKGNTVIVVEHDEEIIMAADRIIDIGPGSGKEGGKILFNGSLKEFIADADTTTARYLRNKNEIPVPKERRRQSLHITLRGACTHNLKNVDLTVPLKSLTVVTGVSGAGKSSLINHTLVIAVTNFLNKRTQSVDSYKALELPSEIKRIVTIDQKPLSRNSRSTPVTYVKVFDDIRSLYASLPMSREQGYSESYFSFNVKEGTCPTCKGMGQNKLESESEDLWLICSSCQGKRFSQSVLRVIFRGKSIGDLLQTTVTEAASLFSDKPHIGKKLEYLADMGLGHLELGRPLTTLSGGENQRLKLAAELLISNPKHTLYVLDEPTIGLHNHDLKAFLKIIDILLAQNTVIIIEHNMHVAKMADMIIDMGPGGGIYGGRVIDYGTPEEIAKSQSPTGKALRRLLDDSIYKARKSKTQTAESPKEIVISNAFKNNLRHIDLTIPIGKMTVISGPCASGKNSLLTETLHAEGLRVYAESLPPYLRKFFCEEANPCVSSIMNLSPVIGIRKRFASRNPRSTVGTTTALHSYFQKLFSAFGTGYCSTTGEKLINVTDESITDFLVTEYKDVSVMIAAPVPSQTIKEYEQKGFVKCLINQKIYPLEQLPGKIKSSDTTAVLIDRLKIGDKINRLTKAIRQAFAINPDEILVVSPTKSHKFSPGFIAPSTGKRYPPVTPSLFSFNCEDGLCPECLGSGTEYLPDFNRNHKLSITSLISYLFPGIPQELSDKTFRNINPEDSIDKLTPSGKEFIFKGAPPGHHLTYKNISMRWRGLAITMKHLAKYAPESIKADLKDIMIQSPCGTCGGSRLSSFANNVRVSNKTIGDIMNTPLDDVCLFLESEFVPEYQSTPDLQILAGSVKRNLIDYITMMKKLGLGHLTAGRLTETLSNGEAYGLRFIDKIMNNLSRVTYLIEDPSMGIHPQEVAIIVALLKDLTRKNNTIVVSSNHPNFLNSADHNIRLGPGSGPRGGAIVNKSEERHLRKHPADLGERNSKLHLKGCCSRNLKNISISVPLKTLTCICGVSGSGKSTLLFDEILPAAEKLRKSGKIEEIVAIKGHEDYVSQKSDIGTYLEIAPFIRKFFSDLPESRALNLTPSYFSNHTENGMCSACLGTGFKQTDLSISSPLICNLCNGFGLNPVIQEVKYHNKHYGNILKSSLAEIQPLFAFQSKFNELFRLLKLFNMDYLELGRRLTDLSFGERKKVKIIKLLNKLSKKSTLFLFDEISLGLDPSDLTGLIEVFNELIRQGNSIVCIEHNPAVIASSPFLIELGPRGGEEGGALIYEGSSIDVFSSKQSIIKDYL